MTFELDKVSCVVTCLASVQWTDLEEELNESGYTLGYCNPRHQKATIEDLVTKNHANRFYRYYGHPVDWCVGLVVEGKDGVTYTSKRVPRSAAGPDFRRLFLGMGRRFGRLDQVTLKIHCIPDEVDWVWSYWPEMTQAKALIDELSAIHIHPSFAGTYSVDQQPVALKKDKMTLLSIRFVGSKDMVRCYSERTLMLTKQLGGKSVRMPRRKTIALLERLVQEGQS